jgi:hypothetical protein
MDFYETVNRIILYFQTNIYVTVIVCFILFLILIRKPKLFFTLLMLTIIVLGVFYVISYIASIGVAQKKKLLMK